MPDSITLHNEIPYQYVHVPYSFLYNTEQDLNNASSFTQEDVGKFARVISPRNDIYMLIDHDPPTWKLIGGSTGSGGITEIPPATNTNIGGVIVNPTNGLSVDPLGNIMIRSDFLTAISNLPPNTNQQFSDVASDITENGTQISSLSNQLSSLINNLSSQVSNDGTTVIGFDGHNASNFSVSNGTLSDTLETIINKISQNISQIDMLTSGQQSYLEVYEIYIPDFSADPSTWNAPSGWTLTKFGSSSFDVTHNLDSNPSDWSGIDVGSSIFIVPTDSRNMEILNNNQIRFTNISGSGELKIFVSFWNTNIPASTTVTVETINITSFTSSTFTYPNNWSVVKNGNDLIITHDKGIAPFDWDVFVDDSGTIKSMPPGYGSLSLIADGSSQIKLLSVGYTYDKFDLNLMFK